MTRILLLSTLLLLLLAGCHETPTAPKLVRDSLAAGSALYYTTLDSTGAPAVMLLNYDSRASRAIAGNAVLLCRPMQGNVLYTKQLASWPIVLNDIAGSKPRTVINGLMKGRLSPYNGTIALYDAASIRLASSQGDLTGTLIRVPDINDIDFIPGSTDMLVGADAGLYRVDAGSSRATPYTLPQLRTFGTCRYPRSGKLLYFIAHTADSANESGLYILDIETNRTRLVAPRATTFELSDDNRFVVFVRDRELWLANTSTFLVARLGGSGVVEGSALSWSYSNNWISYTSEENGKRYLEIINTVDPDMVVRIAETEYPGYWGGV